MKRRPVKKRRLSLQTLETRRVLAASLGWDGPGLGSADLTYTINGSPNGLSQAETNAAIESAFDAWASAADISFSPTTQTGLRDSIDISFVDIDGTAGTLAQAYFPDDVNPDRIAGDIQFDISESWEVGNALGNRAFDLVWVAAHEIGHSLGLDHAHAPGSVLSAFVTPNQTFTGLSSVDAAEIQELYAAADASSTSNDSPSIDGTGLQDDDGSVGELPTNATDDHDDDDSETADSDDDPFPRKRWRRGGHWHRWGSRLDADLVDYNYVNPTDVNGDNHTSALDALMVINQLNRFTSSQLNDLSEFETIGHCDVDGNGAITAMDALTIVNAMNRGTSDGVASITTLDDTDPVLFDDTLDIVDPMSDTEDTVTTVDENDDAEMPVDPIDAPDTSTEDTDEVTDVVDNENDDVDDPAAPIDDGGLVNDSEDSNPDDEMDQGDDEAEDTGQDNDDVDQDENEEVDTEDEGETDEENDIEDESEQEGDNVDDVDDDEDDESDADESGTDVDDDDSDESETDEDDDDDDDQDENGTDAENDDSDESESDEDDDDGDESETDENDDEDSKHEDDEHCRHDGEKHRHSKIKIIGADPEAFVTRFDTNDDAALSESEVSDQLWAKFTDLAVDADANGLVTADELNSVIAAAHQEAFDKKDSDGDGLITESEVGDRYWSKISAADTDSDGGVSFAELSTFRPEQSTNADDDSKHDGRDRSRASDAFFASIGRGHRR